MNTWETLVASALVGIDRQSPVIDFTDPVLYDYQAALQNQSASQQILAVAGLITAYQTVGQGVAKASLPLPIATDSEKLTCCSPQTTQHLSKILQENRYSEILPEILQLLAQAQQTVPPDFLPLLLEVGKRDKKIRPLILPILGDLGRWLVHQNRQWEYGLGAKIADVDLANLQEIWATGSRSERSAALAQWRELQPAEARQALAASWKQEKADDRAAWLEILQTGLSLADEEFLEVALVDRSEPVRHQAIHLLNQLASRYRQQLTKLATEFLVIKDDANTYQIQIRSPQVDALEWIAVGLLDKPSNKAGAKPTKITIEQLSPVLIGADLDAWPQDIDRLVTGIQSLTASNIILSSLAKAACYQQRMDWIEVLITRSPTVFTNFNAQTLLSSLPHDDNGIKERFFTQLLIGDNAVEALPNNIMVMMGEQYWSKALSSLVFQKFHQYAQQQSYQYYVQQLSSNISSHLDISILPEVQQLHTGLAPDKFNYSTCIEFLEFRRDIQAVFDTT
jgi:Family of unknown function (DUF5691)